MNMTENTPATGPVFNGTAGPLRPDTRRAILLLEDGTAFHGLSCGAPGEVCGVLEVDTSMIGYQRTISNPENTGRLIIMTYPQIGNYGVNAADLGDGVCIGGLIVRSICYTPSNFRMECSLPELLREKGIPAIEDIDTRALVRHIRDNAAPMRALICTEAADAAEATEATDVFDARALLERLRATPATMPASTERRG